MNYEIYEYEERLAILNEIAALEYWEHGEATIFDCEGNLL
jgi:hypothetical protein